LLYDFAQQRMSNEVSLLKRGIFWIEDKVRFSLAGNKTELVQGIMIYKPWKNYEPNIGLEDSDVDHEEDIGEI